MKTPLITITRKDFDVQVFRCGGKGGQKQNKTSSGVRIVHRDSGAVGESREERSQFQNKKIAFERLSRHHKFKVWLNRVAHEAREGKSIDEIVQEQMSIENLKIEGRDDSGKWVELNEE